jgi:transformation/transcription domain-associated protein
LITEREEPEEQSLTNMAGTYSTATTSTSPQVDNTQMNTFRSYVTMIGDPSAKDEIKLRAAQELSEHFEAITQCAGYQSFLDHSMKIFLKVLQDGEPHFISEHNMQQVSIFFL